MCVCMCVIVYQYVSKYRLVFLSIYYIKYDMLNTLHFKSSIILSLTLSINHFNDLFVVDFPIDFEQIRTN